MSLADDILAFVQSDESRSDNTEARQAQRMRRAQECGITVERIEADEMYGYAWIVAFPNGLKVTLVSPTKVNQMIDMVCDLSPEDFKMATRSSKFLGRLLNRLARVVPCEKCGAEDEPCRRPSGHTTYGQVAHADRIDKYDDWLIRKDRELGYTLI